MKILESLMNEFAIFGIPQQDNDTDDTELSQDGQMGFRFGPEGDNDGGDDENGHDPSTCKCPCHDHNHDDDDDDDDELEGDENIEIINPEEGDDDLEDDDLEDEDEFTLF